MMRKENSFMGTVKVGPKGQIVIPKEIRDVFEINPGDTLLMLADVEKGIAIERMETFNKIAEEIFKGRGSKIYPDKTQEEMNIFAGAIKQMSEEEK